MLPILELTLSELWQRRRDGILTHDAYRRIGGVTGSLTTWCDTALNQLPPNSLPIAQRMLTSLVRPAAPRINIPAIRAQVPLTGLRELTAGAAGGPDSGDAVGTVLAALTRDRIITTRTSDAPSAEPVAELIHDALIRDWGRLREWVSEDRRFQEWFMRAREQQARWADGNNQEDLIGGTALAEGLDLAQQRRLPTDIAEFLAAGKRRQQTAIRRSQRLNAILASLLVVALLAAGGALWQWRTAETRRQKRGGRKLSPDSSPPSPVSSSVRIPNSPHCSPYAPTAPTTTPSPWKPSRTLRPSRSTGACPVTRIPYAPWRSAPMEELSPPSRTTGPCGYGAWTRPRPSPLGAHDASTGCECARRGAGPGDRARRSAACRIDHQLVGHDDGLEHYEVKAREEDLCKRFQPHEDCIPRRNGPAVRGWRPGHE